MPPPARRRSDAVPDPAQTRRSRPPGRQRSVHSLEAIIDAAVALLDEAGEPALTFRALAARLGGGVGSVYWYVSSKDELLDRATDAVLGEVLTATETLSRRRDPIMNLRALGLALFTAMESHPWLAAYLLRDVGMQPNSLRLYERFGQQLLRLELTTRQRFHAVSAIVHYVVGVGAEMGSQALDRAAEVTHEERAGYLVSAAEQWRELDPEEFPFVHEVVREFEMHQDTAQFVAGLDLLLAGLRVQSGVASGGRPTRA